MIAAQHDRITIDPDVLVGKPTIRGLRISVEQILRALSAGVPEAELLADYPISNSKICAPVMGMPPNWWNPSASSAFPTVRLHERAHQCQCRADRGRCDSPSGSDVLHVRDVDPRMADIDILAWAVCESRLVVSMDKDFGEQPHPLVVQLLARHAGFIAK